MQEGSSVNHQPLGKANSIHLLVRKPAEILTNLLFNTFIEVGHIDDIPYISLSYSQAMEDRPVLDEDTKLAC